MTHKGKAYAKINLSLDVLSRMENGYHRLKSVMQTVSLCDEVTIEIKKREAKPSAGDGKTSYGLNEITVDTGLPYIPNDERNIAVKAAALFFKHTGITGHFVNIYIKKNIPVCAGLGGGSADAACVLRMLDGMFKSGLGRETLETIAGEAGSDVPFCIDGGTKLAEGRGELLTDLPPLPECSVVICKPPFNCSTPELFARVRCKDITTRPDTEGLIQAIGKNDINAAAKYMYNIFEDILPHGKTGIEEIKSTLLEYGASGAVMTGSGPAVFGIFDIPEHAKAAYRQLKGSYADCFLAVPAVAEFIGTQRVKDSPDIKKT